MENLDYFIKDLALMTLTAGAITLIFKKIKLPVVLGYIVAGFLIGPNFVYLPTVVETANIHTWAEIGVVFLMFALGLEFSFTKIAKVGVPPIVTAITVISCMVAAGYLIGTAMGWNSIDSIFLGGMISMSSTMIILKAYDEYNLKKEKFASLILSTMIVEDIGGVFIMIVLSTAAVGKNVSGTAMVLHISILMLMLVIWLVLGIFLIPTFLKKTVHLMNDESLLIVSVAICLVMVVISCLIGFSSALGAFMAGSILAGTVSAERIDRLITPIKDLFGAVFFISVGMMVVPGTLIKYIVPVIIITLAVIFGQMIFSTLGLLFSGQSLHTAVKGGTSMVQVGEFSFIIAALGTSLKVTSDFLYPVIVCVSVITIFTTPLFIKNSEPIYRIVKKIVPERAQAFFRRYTSERVNTKEKDDDWKIFLKRYSLRTLICSGALYLIYIAGIRLAAPFIESRYSGTAADIALAAGMIILMAPFISLMWLRRGHIYKKLWLKSRDNRLPLILLFAFRAAISVLFVVLTCHALLDIPVWLLTLFSAAVVLLVMRSDFLKGRSIRLEAVFVSNLNEKILHKWKKERGEADEDTWLDDRLFAVEFTLLDAGEHNTVEELYHSRMFHVMAARIIRDGKNINMPMPHEKIFKGDRIQVISSREQLEAYLLVLEKDEHIREPEEPMITLKEYICVQTARGIEPEEQIMCCAVEAEKGSSFIRKSIKSSGFRNKYGGFIVAVERGNLPMIDPSIKTVIEEGDILWVLGTQNTADRLLHDGLLEE